VRPNRSARRRLSAAQSACACPGIVAFSQDGYRSFVRIGVSASNLDTLQVTPLPDSGWSLAGRGREKCGRPRRFAPPVEYSTIFCH